jgi:citrate lyase subunit beta / citryl-CoA lyase
MARSWLYVPGDRPDRVAKALTSGADAVIVDLEDAVAPADKRTARDALAALPDSAPCEVWVNAGEQCAADLAVIPFRAVAGLVVAKCDSAAWLGHVASYVPPTARLAPLVESARAVSALPEICGHPRTALCHLGELDLLADLGGGEPAAESLLQPARVALIYASAAAGIAAPIGGVHRLIDDLAALSESSAMFRQLGFGGRAVIHPSHVGAVNAAFTPTAAERSWAEDVLGAVADAAAARSKDGAMVDEAVARRARRILGR